MIRMVKTQAQKEKTSSGFSGQTDDEFWLGVISKYVKQQKKALAEFEKLGDAAEAQKAETQFEIEYLAPFLPALLSEKEVEAIVDKVIGETGAVGQKMIGRVMGAIMKDYKDKVDPGMVRKIAQEKLG